MRVGSFGRIRSKEEAVAKCAKTTKVVDCKGHEMNILSNFHGYISRIVRITNSLE